MSAAVAEPTAPAAEPTIDDLFAAAGDELAARTAEPAPERTTPDDAPAPDEPTRDEPADTTTSGPERDESGRFKPKGDEPAEDAPRPAQGQQQAPQRELTAEERAALLERQLASVRGNAERDQRMAAERARQEALAEAEKNERQRITNLLDEYQRAGHDVTQARQQWAQQWRQEDDQKREREDTTRRAGTLLSEVDVESGQRLLNLYHDGAQALAEDTGLSLAEIRAFWQEPEERERFKRASMQTAMAQRLPGAGFNAQALNDYMHTAKKALDQVAEVKKSYAGALAARDKEIARLTQQLNRLEAPDAPPETPARGGGTRRKEASTLDEAHAQLEQIINQNPQLVRS